MLALAIMAAMTATTAIANDCRSGVDHKVGCGPQYRPDYRFNEHDRGRQPHPQAVWRGNDGWILPALIFGSLIAIEANRPAAVIIEQPMYVQPQPTLLPPAPYGYKYINAIDPVCNCNKIVLVPIN